MNESAYPPIGDYGLIGDMHSCALVSKAGSIDWCCLPRFDGRSVFGRLLDWNRGGCYGLAPKGVTASNRRYLPNTNVLETTFETDGGRAVLTDFMPVSLSSRRRRSTASQRQIVRILRCTSGSIEFLLTCHPRFDYGSIVPHVSLYSPNFGLTHGGPDAISVFSTVDMREHDDGLVATGRLTEGQQVVSAVTFEPDQANFVSRQDEETLLKRLAETTEYWESWAGMCTYKGAYRDDVVRAALTLKALTYVPTGAVIASPTTSLPEVIGGVRNWDYRYTWIRDATFALYALFILGYTEEAHEFKRWLEWSTMGRARDLQVMYGITGERRLTEIELNGLEGYKHSRPVRIGNGAHSQLQLDIYGEIMDSAHLYRRFGGKMDEEYWNYLRSVVQFVLDHWKEPDDGIWEPRSGRQQFVFSKVMCWVALDRAIKAAVELNLPGDVELWKRVRQEIRDAVLSKGYDADRGAFMQAFDSKALDASVMLLPLVGFLPADDPRMRSTIKTIKRELTTPEGLVYRYRDADDGIGGEEGTFLICSFWLVDNLVFCNEREEATALFEKLRTYSNDLDLYSEEIDPRTMQLLGNFPQAFTHIGMINTAVQLGTAPRRPHYT